MPNEGEIQGDTGEMQGRYREIQGDTGEIGRGELGHEHA
jgi:hypothetical protein